MDLTSLMSALLSDQNITSVAHKAGVSEEEAASVLATALPVMLNGANGQASDANTTESFFHALRQILKDPFHTSERGRKNRRPPSGYG